MKGKWFKRCLAMGLVFSMTAALCAGCGKDKNANANAGLAKEHVYKLQAIELPDFGGDDYSVSSSVYLNGTVYLMLQIYHWSADNNDKDIRLVSIKDDGSDVGTVKLEIPPKPQIEGVTRPEEGDEPQEGGDESAEDSGTEEPAEEEGEDGAADTGIADEVYPSSDIWENMYFSNYCFSPDGSIFAIENYNYEDYTDQDNYISIYKSYLCCWNVDGSLRWQHEIEEFGNEEEWIYLNTMITASDGTLYLMLAGDNAYKVSMDAEGNLSERIPIKEESADAINNGSFYFKEDGSAVVMYSDSNDWSKQYLATYDVLTDTLGEPSLLPASLSWNGYNSMSTGTVSDLVYSNREGVYTYNIGNEASVCKMDFVNSDLLNPSFNVVVELDDKSFLGLFYENYDGQPKAGIFTYVSPEDIPDKGVLVLAGNYVNDEIKRRVVDFNRSSEEYRIVVKEYNSLSSYEDYQAGYTQLNNDIITGKMPDILVTEGLPVENYASKRLLADVGKLIEEDEELSQVEFVQNVFDAFSMDGKLYYVIPQFGVGTMLAKTSLVGDRTSWTMEEAKKFMETMPSDMKLMGDMTRSEFFSNVMQYCGSDFIDVGTGKCDFSSQNFLELMEYAKGLPTEYTDDYWEDYSTNYQTQYRDNKTLLCRYSFSSLRDLNYAINGRMGEDVSYVGFPTGSGQGSYVYSYQTYALSSRSSYLDAAWDFIKYYLMDEYQSTLTWNMPIQKKYFMEFAQAATQRPYWEDEDGNRTEYDDTYYLNGEQIILPPLTQEQLDKAIEFVFSIQKCSYNNNDVMNIINEEMEAFFSGQKTAQEVAQIIQSRTQVYVDANR